MNVSVIKIPPQKKDFLQESWSIKESIRKEQDLLHQSKFFFNDTFVDGESYVAINDLGKARGFGIVLQGTYLALLGVDPDVQGEDIGRQIMDRILEDHQTIRCHTRVTNDQAISFYKGLGFKIQEIDTNYYENDEDAAVLKYSKNDG